MSSFLECYATSPGKNKLAHRAEHEPCCKNLVSGAVMFIVNTIKGKNSQKVLYMNQETTSLRGRTRNRWQDEMREDGRLTYFLTPWSRVLLENLTGLQLVKKFSAFYGTRRFITAFTSACHLSLS
jgi:hypothetical protein